MDGDTGTLSDPLLRTRSQHVDDVGPVIASPITVTEQVRGDRVTVCLSVDQDASKGAAGVRVERFEDCAEVLVVIGHVPSSTFNVR